LVETAQLTAAVPANLIASPLTAQVTVSNPEAGNTSISSNVATFTVNPATTSGFVIITASPLQDGTVGSAYSQALAATGGAVQLIAAPLKRSKCSPGWRPSRYFRDQLIAAPLKLSPGMSGAACCWVL
jgi:hypothetical protein